MSYNNSKSGKTLKGQLVTIPGSPSGEVIFSSKFAYNDACMVEYHGEAKFGTKDSANKWFLKKYEYGSACELTGATNACNIVTTKATQLSINTSINAPLITLTIVGGVFDQVEIGDKLEIDTTSNKWMSEIVQKISDTELRIQTDATAIDETGTAITDLSLLITLLTTKEFQHRRWDKREFYIYA